MTLVLVAAGALVAFPLIMMAVILVAAMAERRFIRTFVPIPDGRPLAVSDYAASQNAQAEAKGFRRAATCVHAKGGTYQIYATLWVSPESDILAVVGGGRIAKIKHRKTTLHSLHEDGRYTVTTDEFGEKDLSELKDIEVLMNGSFDELLDRHRRRLESESSKTRPFTESQALQAYAELESAVARRMVERGLAKFIDAEQSEWKYSIRGAMGVGIVGYFQGFASAFKQQERANLKRPAG